MRIVVSLSLALMMALSIPEFAFAKAKTVDTSVGSLSIGRNDESKKCVVALTGKQVLDFDCEFSYEPKVLGHFASKVSPFDDVVVVQEIPMGNACNGGPLHILGFKKASKPKVFDAIDFCGGKDPVIEKDGEAIGILFPGGPPNIGNDIIPDKYWVLKAGVLSKASFARK